ncbi:MAG: DUF177 domain-containing protein [Bryobacteraceae bacterium]
MFLSIKEMEFRKVPFEATFEPGQIDFSGAEVRQLSSLHAKGSAVLLERTEGEVCLRGEFEVEMGADCDRCLRPSRFPLAAGFDLFYRPTPVGPPEAEEIEIHEGEAEVGFYQGAGLQLGDVLREQILLALPMQRICRPDCKGICPVCGLNRNESVCVCRPQLVDDRWSALRKL